MELNNENDNNINEEKIKTKKKKNILIKIVFIYALIATIVTVGSIMFYKKTGKNILDYYTLEKNVEETEITVNEENNDEPKEIVRSKLTDKYYLNNLKIEEIEQELKNDYNYKDELERSYKNKLRYIKISGLKSKKVENKINTEIKEKINSLILQEELQNDDIDYINIVADVNANFANLLSITVSKNIVYYTEDIYEYKNDEKRIYLNYRLDTGEELEFEDLFSKDASIKNILSQNIYTSLAFEYGMEYIDDIDSDMDNIDYSKIENEVFNFIDEYNKGNDMNFWFSSSHICIEIEEIIFGIEMDDYSQYIAVFNLVNPEKSLYERGNLKRINYVFATPYISDCEVFKKISDDIFLSIFCYYTINEEDEYYQAFSKTVQENLNKIIEVIQKNEKIEYNKNGKAKIYNFNSVYESEEELYISGEKVEVELDNFDNEIDKVFSNASRSYNDADYFLSITEYEEKDNEYDIRIEENENGSLVLFQLKDGEQVKYGTDGTKRDLSDIEIID